MPVESFGGEIVEPGACDLGAIGAEFSDGMEDLHRALDFIAKEFRPLAGGGAGFHLGVAPLERPEDGEEGQ
jgi:hypothetical protein